MSNNGNLRTWFLRGLLVCTALILASFVGELAVRVFAPQMTYRFPVGLFQNHPTLGYTFVPSFEGRMRTPEFRTHVHINSRGLRSKVEVSPDSDDSSRILFIGDSFTSMFSVEEDETWTHVIGERLSRQHPDRHIEVLNAGVPGYNTFQEVEYLREDGFALAPDLVVLAFFVGNDIMDNANDLPSVVVRNGYLVGTREQDGILPYPIRSFLQKHSQLYHLAWPLLHALPRLGHADAKAPKAPAYTRIYKTDPPRDVVRGLQATRKHLEAFKSLLRSHRVPGLVVIVPDPIQVGAAHQRYNRDRWNGFGEKYKRVVPSKQVRAICESVGIPVYDFFDTFALNEHPENLYFPVDGHWTVAGNQLAGDALLSRILNFDIFR